MTEKIKQALAGGIIGTVAMTILTLIGGMMGMPKMSPPDMLSTMMGIPISVGWMMHFMIGITFALMYTFFFIRVVRKVNINILKGAIFGMAAFIFAQIAIAGMIAIFGDVPPPEGSMMLMMLGSIMGHVVFGVVVAMFVKEGVK